MNYDLPSHISGDTWNGITCITVKTSGTPVDLTNSKIKVQVRPEYDIASPVFCEFLSETGDIVILTPSISGKLSIIPKIVEIPPGIYQYDLSIEFPTGIKRTYLKGNWEIISNVSI